MNVLLPLREKVAGEAGRMRGLAPLSDRGARIPVDVDVRTTPHPSRSRATPSPARGEGKRWRRTLLAIALGLTPALSACGFQPLYAQQGVVQNLAAVEVVAPGGRTGFLLRDYLDDALAKNRNAAPVYRMTLRLGETRYPRGVRIDNVATRYEYVLTASYVLTQISTGAVAKRGQVRVELTYESADQPYAAITAQQDAQDRASEEAARRIQLELASWLAAHAQT